MAEFEEINVANPGPPDHEEFLRFLESPELSDPIVECGSVAPYRWRKAQRDSEAVSLTGIERREHLAQQPKKSHLSASSGRATLGAGWRRWGNLDSADLGRNVPPRTQVRACPFVPNRRCHHSLGRKDDSHFALKKGSTTIAKPPITSVVECANCSWLESARISSRPRSGQACCPHRGMKADSCFADRGLGGVQVME